MEQKIDKDKLKVTTGEFRVSHPHVFKPSQMKRDGKPLGKENYSIEMLFDKKSTDLKPLQRAIHNACVAKWGADKSQWPSPLRNPIKDGDKPMKKGKDIKAEHKGCWVVRASTSAEYSAPHVVDQDVQPILKASDFYPGCYARAQIMSFAYEVSDEMSGVKFILDGVQKLREGKALGGKKPADQMFGAVESSDDDDESFDSMSDDESEETFDDEE